jgi:hypothetical protein
MVIQVVQPANPPNPNATDSALATIIPDPRWTGKKKMNGESLSPTT